MKKASDLRIPFVWAERHPVFLEKCLYIPTFYDNHEKWAVLPWDHPLFFGRKGVINMEFCSGNGQWIGEKAKQHPEILWVAVEKLFERAKKIWALIFREKLDNLFVVCGKGETFIRHYIEPHSVNEVFINFPDPWPKLRHAKHRLVQKPFLEDLARITRPKGHATFVTDDEPYRDEASFLFSTSCYWKNCFSTPFITEWPDYGGSWFYDFWKARGKTIHYQRYACV